MRHQKHTKDIALFMIITFSIVTLSQLGIFTNQSIETTKKDLESTNHALDVTLHDIAPWEAVIRPSDVNSNGISDKLERKLLELATKATSQPVLLTGEELQLAIEGKINLPEADSFSLDEIPVIVSFPRGNISDIVSTFSNQGGQVKSWYDVAINGFAGTISEGGLDSFCSILQENNVPFLVEEDEVVQAQLYYASRNMNLRPLAWSTYGFRGDPSTAVAVIDSGIDDSHAVFSPGYSNGNSAYKLTGWSDQISGITSPYDDNGHGSHCAGIVAGSGNYSVDGSGRAVATWGEGFNYAGYSIPSQTLSITAARFNVTTPGTIDIVCTYTDSTSSGDRVYTRAYLYRGETVVDSYVGTAASWTDTLTIAATTGTLGDYSLRLEMQLYGADGYCDNPVWRFRGIVHWPFSPPALGSNNLWQGIAPDSRLVGIKVLSSSGSGSLSDIVDGVNWAITNKILYNITVISMSLGGSGGQTSFISAVNNAVNSGIVTVVAAGNSGSGGNNIGSPGDADNVITVAAMSDADRVTDFSSQGGPSYTGATIKPDIMAPGGSYYNFSMFSVDTNDNDAQTTMTDGFTNDMAPMLGTSMATPAVAGAANLVIDALGGRQNWNFTANEAKLVKALLLMTATETYPLQREIDTAYSPLLNRGGKDVHEGYGRINVDAAIEACIYDVQSIGPITRTLWSSAVKSLEKHVIGGHVYLVAGVPYIFTLDVPTGADFDLHLYSGSASTYGEPVQVSSSISAISGQDELITYTPSSSGVYYVVAKAISGSGNATLNVAGNDYAPNLTDASIAPLTGNQTTPFNLSVVYTDADDNLPQSINVNVNGTLYPLTKQNPADINYTNGCVYQRIMYFQPGIYTLNFSCFDGRFSNSTPTLAGPNVTTIPSTHSPGLTGGAVSPSTGTSQSTMFTYTVTYTDLDNDAASYVRVNIDGNQYLMAKQDVSETNYIDGCIYTYSRLLWAGTHQYNFTCSDGSNITTTSTLSGPTVAAYSTGLQNYIMTTGIPYSWQSTSGATQLSISDDGYVSQSLPFAFPFYGQNFTTVYVASNGLIAFGTGSGFISSIPTTSPTNAIAIFGADLRPYYSGSGGGYVYIRSFGTYYAISWVNVYYYGSTTIAGTFQIVLYANGTIVYNYDFTAGSAICGLNYGVNTTYYNTYTGLSSTTNDFSIRFQRPMNTYAPTLTIPTVTPGTGNQSTLFSFTTIYTDLDNNAPQFVNLLLNGTPAAMSKVNPADNGFTDGCAYRYQTYLPHGLYNYSFECADGGYYTKTITVPGLNVAYVNAFSPILTPGNPVPGNGYGNLTPITYTATYTDQENNEPIIMEVIIDGITHAMIKTNPLDVNYMDGCVYTFTTSLPATLNHTYMYNCSDGIFNVSSTIATGPRLLNITPMSLEDGLVLFYPLETNASDYSGRARNGVPSGMTYQAGAFGNAGIFTGTSYIDTTVANIAINYSLCALFRANSFSSNSYVDSPLIDSDYASYYGTGMGVSSTTISMVVNNQYLTHAYTFLTGRWYYLVVTFDRQNNRVTSYINGTMIQQSSVTFGTPSYIRNFYVGRDPAYGYSFNGMIDEVRIYNKTLSSTDVLGLMNRIVNFEPPELTNTSVDPSSGTQNTLFTFNVTYTDPDNNQPGNVDVVINGSVYSMSKMNPADVSYTDGCVYRLSVYLQPGFYEYYFTCNDYGFTNTTAVFSGLNVTETNAAAPVLSNTGVSPARGTNTTLYVFYATYTDADNNLPASINITINATVYPMSQMNASDTNAMDGKLYRYVTALTWGLYRFQINASDGTYTNASAWVDAPEVNPFLALPPQYLGYQTLTGSATEYAWGSWATSDAVYTTGYTTSYGNGNDLILVKWDLSGSLVWYRTFGGASTDYGYGVWGDGIYIYTAGYTNSYGAGGSDFLLVKWDMSGNQVWYRTWGGTGSDIGLSITGNGTDVFVAGYTLTYTVGGYDIGLVKWDTNGVFQWYRTWGGSSDEVPYGITTYGGFVYTTGYTYSYGAGGDLVLVNWDVNGVFQWYRTWGSTGYEQGSSILCDGSAIYIAGYTSSFGAGNYDFCLQRWSMSGTIEWYRTWGGTSSDYGRSMILLGSDIYICGYGYNGATASTDMALVRWTTQGTQTWSAFWGGTSTEYGRSVVAHGNTIFAHVETYSYGTGTPNLALVRYSIGFKPQLTLPANGSTFFNGNTTFSWSSLNSALIGPITFTLQISNTSNFASTVLQFTNISEQASTTSALIDVDLQTGMYYWRVLPSAGIFRGAYSDSRTINIIRNDFAPGLVSASVSPGSGDQFTNFLFNVTYVDQDDNQPVSILVYINGTAYSMAKQDVMDTNYVDGCIYVYTASFQHFTSNLTHYFTCSDGKYGNTTVIYPGPNVVETNTHIPQLLNANVSPLSGTNITAFTFSVVYLDLDDNLPVSLTITINSSTYTMNASSPLDTNVLDGKMYQYTTTLPWGLYRFRCNCSDGTFQNGTAWIDAPVANPFFGLTGSSEIENVAIFRDLIPWGYNVVPTYLTNLGITYTIYTSSSLGVVSLAPFDKVIVESEQYTSFYSILVQPAVRSWLEAYISSGGIFEMHFWHQSSENIPGTLPGGYTEVANTQNNFIINTTYQTHPIVAGVVSGGLDGGSYSMQYLTGFTGSEETIIYDTSIMQARLFTRQFGSGQIIYVGLAVEFGAGYGTGSYSTLLINLLQYGEGTHSVVELLLPANGSTFFNGNVTFSWSSLAPAFGPITYHWQVSNMSTFSEILVEEWNIPEVPGNTSIIQDIDLPTGIYYWRVCPVYSVFQGNWSSTSYFTCIRNYFMPSLSNGSFSPPIGNQLTHFNFTVTFTDADDNSPAWIQVRINGTAYPMNKLNVTDMNYSDGVIYQCSKMLQPGVYEYEFLCGDGRFNATSGVYSNLTVIEVNYNVPVLSAGLVSPASGYNSTTIFTFSVMYTDIDNNHPGSVNVSINWWTFPMAKQNPADINYMDGCVYTYSMTLDANWNYEYWFNCSDRTYLASLGPFQGPTVLFPSNFTKTWSGYNYDYAHATCTDGTYVYTVGRTNSAGAGGYDILLIKWDQNGNEIWYRTWGGASTEYGYGIWSDGNNLYVVGQTGSYGAGSYDLVLVKWSTAGVFQWYRTWGTSYSDYGYGVTGDDTYIYATGVAGASSYNNAVLVKWDANGNQQWYQTWGGSYYEYAYDVYTSGSYVYISGYTSSYGAGGYDMFLTCFTTSGTYQWYRTWGTTSNEYGWGLTGDGTYIYASGYTDQPGYTDVVLVKWDTSGNLQWYQTWGGSYYEYAYDVLVSGTQVFIAGHTTSYGAGVEDFLLVEYTTAGAFVKYNTWGTSLSEYGRGLCKIGTSLYVAGYVYASSTYYDVMLVKFTTSTLSNIQLIAPPSGATVFCGEITFTWSSLAFPLGLVNYTWQLSSNPTFSTILASSSGILGTMSTTTTAINVNFTSGVYYWRIAPVYGRFTGKFTNPYTLNLIQNFLPPRLTSGVVTPGSGNQSTYFTFQVTYTDNENNAPLYVIVNINGTDFLMNKLVSGDTNYMDGCIYTYTTKLVPGPNPYSFSCSDGSFTNSTTTYAGPTVIQVNIYAPTLGNQQVSPTTGSPTTTFTFSVSYYDGDDNAPSFVMIVIDATAHAMTKQTSADTNYVDGCVYTYSTTLPIATHSYQFMASDGNFSVSFGPFGGPVVTSTGGIPSDWGNSRLDGLRIGAVIAHGENNPRTRYPTIASALQQRGASLTDITSTISAGVLANYDVLWIDGGGSAMTSGELDAIVTWVTNGGRFLLTDDYTGGSAASLLGRYSIYYTSSTYSGMYASYIYTHAITSSVSSLYFDYPTAYINIASQPSAYVCARYSTSYNLVVCMNVSTNGRFAVITDEEFFNYYYVANNYRLINNTFGWLGYGLTTGGGNAPTLTSPSVNPSTGSQYTSFQFRVTYTDAENNAPAVMNVVINGTAHTMIKLVSTDTTYTDGCIYVYSTTLSIGRYEYYIVSSDGTSPVATGLFSGPVVTYLANNPPTLSSSSVNPGYGNVFTMFMFTTTYTDSGNEAPIFIRVVVDGIPHSMSKRVPGDIVYTDGCIYDYTTALPAGTHDFSFTCSDGYYVVNSSEFLGLLVDAAVSNEDPMLYIGQVTFDTQSNPVLCTFRIVYQDADNDAPEYIRVVVDGVEYPMNKVTTTDVDYMDGCTYTRAISLASGVHTYRFAASDMYNAVATLTTSMTVPQTQSETPLSRFLSVLPWLVAIAGIGLAIAFAIITFKARLSVKKAATQTRQARALPQPTSNPGTASKPKTPGGQYVLGTEVPYFEDELDAVVSGKGKQASGGTSKLPRATGISGNPDSKTSATISEINRQLRTVIKPSSTDGPAVIPSRGTSPKKIDALKWTSIMPTPENSQASITVEPQISPIPIILDTEATNEFLKDATPVILNGIEVDLVTELRASDMGMYKSKWYSGPADDMMTNFIHEKVIPRNDVLGENIPLKTVLAAVRAMVVLIRGCVDPERAQTKREMAVRQLVEFGAFDMNLPAPYLTDKGLVLRMISLELNPDQVKTLQSPEYSDLDEKS